MTPECASGHQGLALPSRPIRVLELRSVLGTGGGPEKTILLGSARSEPHRFVVTVGYLRDIRDAAFDLGRRATAHGLDYVEIGERHSFDPRIWTRLVDIVREKQIDIVHSHDYKTDFLALLLSWRERIAAMATAHGWIRNTARERFYSRADLRVLAKLAAVIAVSGPIRAEILATGASPGRVHHIPNGVDHRLYRPSADTRRSVRAQLGIPMETPVIGAVGRLNPEKRFDLLLRAVALLREGVRPVVSIVGSGPLQTNLVGLAKELGIEDRVLMLGQRSDVADLLHGFDLFVQTSDTEGVSNAVLEAMASGVPVVATQVGGTSELVEHGVHGLLVPPGDPRGIADAIAASLARLDQAKERAVNARSRVERELSFDARMARVEAIYLDVFERKSLATC